jgi:hypothetical protein
MCNNRCLSSYSKKEATLTFLLIIIFRSQKIEMEFKKSVVIIGGGWSCWIISVQQF